MLREEIIKVYYHACKPAEEEAEIETCSSCRFFAAAAAAAKPIYVLFSLFALFQLLSAGVSVGSCRLKMDFFGFARSQRSPHNYSHA